MDYLKGRDNEVLWLMFRGAELVNEFERDGKIVRAYRYMDGENPVLFVESGHFVKVDQPGVCLFEKWFMTDNSHTKWEQV